MSEKLYSDDEVSQILRLALESTEDEHKHGVTIEELVKVAKEAGIPEERIRSAADRLALQHPEKKGFDLLGCQGQTVYEALTDTELTDDEWDDVVNELRHSFGGTPGTANTIGRSSEWTTKSDLSTTLFTLTPSDGRTKVRATLDANKVAPFNYGIAGFVGAIFLFAVGAPILVKKAGIDIGTAITIMGSGWLATMLGTRYLVGRWYKNQTRQMRRAIERITRLLESGEHRSELNASVTTKEDEELSIRLGEGNEGQ